jgi:predicted naringenin-chalcone synthase
MFITGLGTAVPNARYTQEECWNFAGSAEEVRRLTPRSQTLLRKILLGENGVEARYLALDSLDDIFKSDPDTLHRRFALHAPALAIAAARRALANAGTDLLQVDALIVSTCTGYLCPGLSSYISEGLALGPDILLLDLVGQGCGAALPNLTAAEALLASGRARHVLSVCVEICSAAFYLDDDPGVLVSACLFGDGAAAVVLASETGPSVRSVQWRTAASTTSPAHRDCLRFEAKGGLLRNVLSRQVPELAGEFAQRVLARVLTSRGLRASQIAAWILHAGGPTVLTSVRDRLGLVDADLRWSAGVLRDHGNLSSPSVLFALNAALSGGAPAGYWWMSSFGAGFSCHGALLEVQ